MFSITDKAVVPFRKYVISPGDKYVIQVNRLARECSDLVSKSTSEDSRPPTYDAIAAKIPS